VPGTSNGNKPDPEVCSLGCSVTLVVNYIVGHPNGPIFKGETRKMGRTGCPETLVANYQSMLRNIPEEQQSH
jgi:hypothetical protein